MGQTSRIRTRRLTRCHLLAVAVGLVYPVVSPPSRVVEAQATRETFDVASIRRAPSPSMFLMRGEPSGLTATNATALDLIKFAFDVIERDVAGELPGWVKTARFDLLARTGNGPLTSRRLRAMTRALLEERFRLDASYEQAVGPVFALVMERSDRRMGPRLRASESKCQVDAPLSEFDPMPPRVLDLSERCGVSIFTSGSALSGLFGNRVTMQEYAGYLSRFGGFDRPVVDRTGLNGEFDVAAATQVDMVAPTSQARFLIALREMAGLTLRGEEGTYEVLRIRRIDQPSAN